MSGWIRELRSSGPRLGFRDTRSLRVELFSALVHRLLADRASIDGDTDSALRLIDRSQLQLTRALLRRSRVLESELEPAARGPLYHAIARDHLPIVMARARTLLQQNRGREVSDLLGPLLGPPEDPSLASFLLAASAAGQQGRRDEMSALGSAGTLVAARVRSPWADYARFLLLCGDEEPLHWLARALRARPDPQDRPDDVAAVFALGGLMVDAREAASRATGPASALAQGLALLAEGDAARAIPLLFAASSIDGPWQRIALEAWFGASVERGDHGAASRALDALERVVAPDHRLDTARARWRLERGNVAGAHKALRIAISRSPRAAGPLVVASLIARRTGGDPTVPLAEACRRAPHRADFWQAYAAALREAGREAQWATFETARHALAAGDPRRALESLALLERHGHPALPVRRPVPDANALARAYVRLVDLGAGSRAAMEGAALLLELGRPERARSLLREGVRPIRTAAGGGGPLSEQRPGGVGSGLLLMLGIVLVPWLTSLALRRALVPGRLD